MPEPVKFFYTDRDHGGHTSTAFDFPQAEGLAAEVLRAFRHGLARMIERTP